MKLATPVFLAVCALLGCGKLDRVGDCRALARAVNPSLDRIEAEVRRPIPASYRKAAQEYAALSARLKKEPPSHASVKELATAYADLVAEVETPLLEYAAALESHSEEPREASARTLAELSRRERALVARIASHCAGTGR